MVNALRYRNVLHQGSGTATASSWYCNVTVAVLILRKVIRIASDLRSESPLEIIYHEY